MAGSNGGAAKGIFLCLFVASAVWLGLVLSASGPPEPLPGPPLPTKLFNAPPAGVIGHEDRLPLVDFTPDNPERFPGWEDIQNAVVRVSCNGVATGGGVLLGDGTRMLSAAHVFLSNDGTPRGGGRRCWAVHPSGDRVLIGVSALKSGGFSIPEALGNHFSVAVSSRDWAVVPLQRAPEGAAPLPLADRDTLVLEQDHPVLNISGAHDNFEVEGFLAQVCTYFGAPPTASHLVGTEIIGRAREPGDEWRVARYDCDLGRGGSGSPIIGWHAGAPYVWGILTDSLRGADRCPRVGYTSCYSAGPLVTTMDITE